MTLDSANFERRLRDRIRTESVRPTRSRLIPRFIVKHVITIFTWFFLLMSIVLTHSDHPDAERVWRTIAWLLLATILWRAEFWQMAFNRGEDLPAFEIIPVASKDVFRWYMARELRSSLTSLAGYFVLFAAIAAIYDTGVVGLATAAGASIVIWLFQQSMATAFLSLRLPFGIMMFAGMCCYYVMFGAASKEDGAESVGFAMLRKFALLADYLPTIWPIRTFGGYLLGEPAPVGGYLASTVVIVALAPILAARMAFTYQLPFSRTFRTILSAFLRDASMSAS